MDTVGGEAVSLESPSTITAHTSPDAILCVGSLGVMTLVMVLSLHPVVSTPYTTMIYLQYTTQHNDDLTSVTQHKDDLPLVHNTTMISL